MSVPFLLDAVQCFARSRKLMTRLLRDESGIQLVLVSLVLPIMIGIAAIGTEGGLLAYSHLVLQGTADSAAVSVARAYSANTSANLTLEANAITANYGVANATVSVLNPPAVSSSSCTLASSDSNIGNENAFEVIVTQSRTPTISAFFGFTNSFNICAVAVAGLTGGDCMLALNATAAGAITASGSANITFSGCSIFSNSNNSTDSILLGPKGSAKITVTNGTVGAVGGVEVSGGSSLTPPATSGGSAVSDPYQGVSMPTSSPACTFMLPTVSARQTIGPGLSIGATPIPSSCTTITLTGGITIKGVGNLTLNAATYILNSTSAAAPTLSVSNGGSLSGNNVTLVFTAASTALYPSTMMDLSGGGVLPTVNLTAPTSGTTSGIAIFGDNTAGSHSMPVGTQFSVTNGATLTFVGAIYVPKGAINYSGAANSVTPCSQIVANTFDMANGTGTFANNCAGHGAKIFGTSSSKLLE